MKTVKFITFDEETEGIAVEIDGKQVWQDTAHDTWDQFFRRYMPRGVPVLLDQDTRPGERDEARTERRDDRDYPPGESTDTRLARWLADNTEDPAIRLDVEEGSEDDVPVSITVADLGFLLWRVAERMYWHGVEDIRERHGIRD